MEISNNRLENFRLLILGSGGVVREFYLPALQLLHSLSGAFFVDSSALALKKLAGVFPQARYRQADFKEYFLDRSVKDLFDAVVIALPNHLHAQAVESALSAGFHVLCEKPLALKTSVCFELEKLSSASGRVLAVGMVRRYLPCVLALRQGLKDDLIGAIQEIDIAWGDPYNWVSDSGSFFQRENAGTLADMGVHLLDLIEELVGPLQPVSYQDDDRGGVEANAEFRLTCQAGLPITLTLSRTHKLRNTLILKGQKGELILEKDTFDYCLWRAYHNDALYSRLYPVNPFPAGNWQANLVSCFAQQFLDFRDAAVKKQGAMVTAGRAARTIGLIEWAYGRTGKRQPDSISTFSGSESITRPKLSSPAPVVVTGGTGFIGGHLVARLAELGFNEISVPVRNYMTCAEVARFPVKMPKVNLLEYEEVKKAIRGARFVFHLAYGKESHDAARVTIRGTANVVNAAIDCAAESVVILSTMYVFGRPDSESLVNESWPYHPTGGEYGESKAKMERSCLKRAGNSGRTRIVVLNPSCVYGPKGNTYTQLPVEMAGAGTFCWVEQGKGIANYTFIDNLIDAIILAAGCKDAHGQRFIVNDGFCSWRDFLGPLLGDAAIRLASFNREELAEKNRRKRTRVKDIVKLLAGDQEFIALVNSTPVLSNMKKLLFRCNPKLHQALLGAQGARMISDIGGQDLLVPLPPVWLADIFGPAKTKFSSEKAKKILGWEPSVSLEEGQNRTRNWLKSVKLL